uniref:Hint domain-containing protein n=1 Tax=Lotharella globosa TaxID=91324 RepID=A0A7S3ZAG7_9EUKA
MKAAIAWLLCWHITSAGSASLTQLTAHHVNIAPDNINVLYASTSLSGIPQSGSKTETIFVATGEVASHRVAISTSSSTVYIINEDAIDVPCENNHFNHLFVHPIAQTSASTVNWDYTIFLGGGNDEADVSGKDSLHNCSFTDNNKVRVFFLNLAMAPGTMFHSALVNNEDAVDTVVDEFAGGHWKDIDTSVTATTLNNYLHYEEPGGKRSDSTCQKCSLTHTANATGAVYYVMWGPAEKVQVKAFASGSGMVVTCVDTDVCVHNRPSNKDQPVCFAGDSRVKLESGETKLIRDVRLGDRVQVAAGDGTLLYSPVVFVPHRENSQLAQFVTIRTVHGRKLSVTRGHLVLASDSCTGSPELKRAELLEDGMCVAAVNGLEKIAGVGRVYGHGVYSIVALHGSGQIIVEGIRASSFGTNHAMANAYYHIHRACYYVVPQWIMGSELATTFNHYVGHAAIFFYNLSLLLLYWGL